MDSREHYFDVAHVKIELNKSLDELAIKTAYDNTLVRCVFNMLNIRSIEKVLLLTLLYWQRIHILL